MAAAIAWSGGAAFVASLAYFAYTYAVTLALPPASRPNIAAACAADLALFMVFAIHHSLLARPWVKRWVTRRVPASLERSAYVWTASLLLIMTCAAWRRLPGGLYHQDGAAAWPHLAVVAAGVALTALGARVLDPLDLAGIRQVQQAQGGRSARKRHDTLVESFPFSLVRHPIYLGWVLMVFGVADMTWSRLLMAVLSTSYLVLAVPWEERLLVGQFGAEYEAYRRRVKWRIVPFVY